MNFIDSIFNHFLKVLSIFISDLNDGMYAVFCVTVSFMYLALFVLLFDDYYIYFINSLFLGQNHDLAVAFLVLCVIVVLIAIIMAIILHRKFKKSSSEKGWL